MRSDLTYYKRNQVVILNRAKDYYENNKERLKSMREINIETYPKKKKVKRENMEKIDTTIFLKRKNRD